MKLWTLKFRTNLVCLPYWSKKVLSNNNILVNRFFCCLAPPKFPPPVFLRVVSDSELIVKLHPASNENGDVTHYYVVVVSNDLAEGRQPDDFRLDEVTVWICLNLASLTILRSSISKSRDTLPNVNLLDSRQDGVIGHRSAILSCWLFKWRIMWHMHELTLQRHVKALARKRSRVSWPSKRPRVIFSGNLVISFFSIANHYR